MGEKGVRLAQRGMGTFWNRVRVFKGRGTGGGGGGGGGRGGGGGVTGELEP